MNTHIANKPKKPNYFLNVLQCKCPRCREASMFKNKLNISNSKNMAMPSHCPKCGQAMELEVGFYYGTGYVSYALTVALSVSVFVAFWVLHGISINDNSLYIYLVLNAVVLILFIPYIMRLSRAIWISFFVKYNPDWQLTAAEKPERVIEEQMGNW